MGEFTGPRRPHNGDPGMAVAQLVANQTEPRGVMLPTARARDLMEIANATAAGATR